MNRISRLGGAWAPRLLIAGLVLAFVTAMFPAPASAGHAWGNYHWGRTANPFTVQLGNNVDGNWYSYLDTASSDWSASDVLDTTIVPGGTNPRRCGATSGRVEVCNAKYGRNGWLGLAQIWISGDHIVQGTAKMNDTYFDMNAYNTPAWRQFVMCQEVGHDFGLGHVNETFDDLNTGSCMDYTNDPSGTEGTNGTANNLHPNQHDYDMLAGIYQHPDSANTVSDTSGAGRAGVSGVEIPDPSGPERGGVSRLVTDLGNGNQIVQFVIWADANLIAATHANENSPVVGTTSESDGIPVDGGTHDHEETASTTVVTTDAVNLRAAPSRQAAVLAELAAGTVLAITGPSEWGQGIEWIPVATPDGVLAGYVAADFLMAG